MCSLTSEMNGGRDAGKVADGTSASTDLLDRYTVELVGKCIRSLSHTPKYALRPMVARPAKVANNALIVTRPTQNLAGSFAR